MWIYKLGQCINSPINSLFGCKIFIFINWGHTHTHTKTTCCTLFFFSFLSAIEIRRFSTIKFLVFKKVYCDPNATCTHIHTHTENIIKTQKIGTKAIGIVVALSTCQFIWVCNITIIFGAKPNEIQIKMKWKQQKQKNKNNTKLNTESQYSQNWTR